MSEKYKILSSFIKDMSSETPNVESYLFTKDNISKYELDIDISSNPLKNKLIEVNTCLKFHDKTKQEKKSYFEVVYTSIVRIEDGVKEKKDLQKIVLCDVPTEIYTELEKILINLLSSSGYPGVKFDKKIDFNKLFNEKFN
mgnify:FL=1|tara:strand:+ start:249 stop:671 length:423 start_codon:yes stop_codon:yes gene_type:complete